MAEDLKEKIDELIPEGIKDLGTSEEVSAVEGEIAEGVEKVEDEVKEVEENVEEEVERAEIGGAKIFTSVEDMLKNLTKKGE